VATFTIDGIAIAYEIIGEGQSFVVTPGGRFSKDTPGIRELASELARHGKQVLIWDRPNTGASDICFRGPSESEMQADILAGLLSGLGMGSAVVVGGSGGARVSLLTAARHPEVADKVALLWISGGIYGLMLLAVHYCGESIRAARAGGMEAVAALPEWSEVMARNPGNRQRFLDLDAQGFIETLERWMVAYCPDQASTVPGLTDETCTTLDVPTLVFRSGSTDPHHPRATSEHVAALIPGARLVEPPWGDNEWNERGEAARSGTGHLFERWPMLVPQLLEFADSQQ
jgi:pimeloyl-ACP methyl ester carboxylesterase